MRTRLSPSFTTERNPLEKHFKSNHNAKISPIFFSQVIKTHLNAL